MLELNGAITIPRVRKGQKGDSTDYYEMSATPAYFHVDKDGNISGAVTVRLWHYQGSAKTEVKGETTTVSDNNGLALKNQKFPISLDPTSNADIKQSIDEGVVTTFTVEGIHNALDVDIPIVRDGTNGKNGKDGTSFSIKGYAVAHVSSESDVSSGASGYYLIDSPFKVGLYVGNPSKTQFTTPSDGDGWLIGKNLWVAGNNTWKDLGEIQGPKGEDATTLYTSQDAITWNEEGSGDTASFPDVLIEVSVKIGDDLQPLDKEKGLSVSSNWNIKATVQSGKFTISKSDGINTKNITLSNPQPESGTKDYWLNGKLRITATQNASGKSIIKDIPIALNALGTFKEKITNDTKEQVASLTQQAFTDKGLTGTNYETRITQNANAISSKVSSETYNSDKSSIISRLTTVEQTATSVSASVKEQGEILASVGITKKGIDVVGDMLTWSNSKGSRLLYMDNSGNLNITGNVSARQITTNSGKFKVDEKGILTATDANLTGVVNAQRGTIGGWYFSGKMLTGAEITYDSKGKPIEKYDSMGLSLFDNEIIFNDTNRQAMLGTCNNYGLNLLLRLIDKTNEDLKYGIAFDIQNAKTQNVAFSGRGVGYLNSFIQGYGYQRIYPNSSSQTIAIIGNGTSGLTYDKFIVKSSVTDALLQLPSLNQLRSTLPDAKDEKGNLLPFSFEMTLIGDVGSSRTQVWGRTTSVTKLNSDNYPILLDEGGHYKNGDGHFNLSAGNSATLLLLYNPSATETVNIGNAQIKLIFTARIINQFG